MKLGVFTVGLPDFSPEDDVREIEKTGYDRWSCAWHTKAVKEGLVVSLVAQNPFRIGYDGVNQAVKRNRGGSDVKLKGVDTGATLITRDNANDADVQSLLHPSCKNPPL